MRPKPLMPPATAMVGAWAAAWGRVAAGRALPDVVNAEAPEARRAAAVYFLRCYRRVRGPFGRLFLWGGVCGGSGRAKDIRRRRPAAFGLQVPFLAKRHCGRGPEACPGPPAAARWVATPVGRVTCRLPIVIAPALRCLREARSRGFVAAPFCIRGADSPQLVDLVCRTRRRTLCCAN